jgi:CheY-like chemotaxis protein
MVDMTERAKILLVDDRQSNLLALEAVLSTLDQTLVTASSGDEALRALLKDEFALILLDAQMPGMDGFETASQIKARVRTKDVPIIFLTAVDKDQQHAYRGYAAGGADYISKPFDPWVLRAKVQVFVDLWLAGRRLATQSAFLRRQFEGNVDIFGELDERLGLVEEAVAGLRDHEEIRDVQLLDSLVKRLTSMRQALDVLNTGASPSGATRREHG